MASPNSDDENSGNEDDPFYSLPFENVTADTLNITHFDSDFALDNNTRRRTFARADFEENQRRRLSFETELYVYLHFYVRAYLLSLLNSCLTRIMFWMSAG